MIARLTGVIQPYAWGSTRLHPRVAGHRADRRAAGRAVAGRASLAPSMVDGQPLDELLAKDPRGLIGDATVRGVRSAAAVPAQGASPPISRCRCRPTLARAGRSGLRPRTGGGGAPGRGPPDLSRRLAQARGAVRAAGDRGAVRIPGARGELCALRTARCAQCASARRQPCVGRAVARKAAGLGVRATAAVDRRSRRPGRGGGPGGRRGR